MDDLASLAGMAGLAEESYKRYRKRQDAVFGVNQEVKREIELEKHMRRKRRRTEEKSMGSINKMPRRQYRSKKVLGVTLKGGKISNKSRKFAVRKKVGYKHKKGRKSSYHYPKWFMTLAKGQTPSKSLGTYYAQTAVPSDLTSVFTFWKGRSVMDIDNVLAGYVAATAAASSTFSSGAGSGNAVKTYMCAHQRVTEMRNASPADVNLSFYVLYPRRDLPVSQNSVNQPVIAPAANNLPGSCIIRDPAMWQQPYTDQIISAGAANIANSAGAKIAYNNYAVTPYMNPELCSAFKIRKLKVRFPDGYKSTGILPIGGTVKYVHHTRKPFMVSYNKFGLDGTSTYVVRNEWEVMRGTPLVLCLMRGTPSHDTVTKTNVGTSSNYLDIVQRVNYEVYQFQYSSPATLNFVTTAPPTIAISEQVGEDIDAPVSSTLA